PELRPDVRLQRRRSHQRAGPARIPRPLRRRLLTAGGLPVRCPSEAGGGGSTPATRPCLTWVVLWCSRLGYPMQAGRPHHKRGHELRPGTAYCCDRFVRVRGVSGGGVRRTRANESEPGRTNPKFSEGSEIGTGPAVGGTTGRP